MTARQTVSVIVCTLDGRVLKVTAPRLVDPEEVEVTGQRVSEAFACVVCPDHVGYLRWTTRFVDLPPGAHGPSCPLDVCDGARCVGVGGNVMTCPNQAGR